MTRTPIVAAQERGCQTRTGMSPRRCRGRLTDVPSKVELQKRHARCRRCLRAGPTHRWSVLARRSTHALLPQDMPPADYAVPHLHSTLLDVPRSLCSRHNGWPGFEARQLAKTKPQQRHEQLSERGSSTAHSSALRFPKHGGRCSKKCGQESAPGQRPLAERCNRQRFLGRRRASCLDTIAVHELQGQHNQRSASASAAVRPAATHWVVLEGERLPPYVARQWHSTLSAGVASAPSQRMMRTIASRERVSAKAQRRQRWPRCTGLKNSSAPARTHCVCVYIARGVAPGWACSEGSWRRMES